MTQSDFYSDAFRAVAVLYRNDAAIRRLNYQSITIDSALNEARESRIILSDDEVLDFELGDKIEIFTSQCTYGMFYVTQWRVESRDSEQEKTVFLSDCMYLLRIIGVSGSTVFKNDTLTQILALIPGYVKEETGDALWISEVNPSTFTFDGRLDTDAGNLLEMLRSIVIATGNAMRISSSTSSACGIEIGQFGAYTELVFVDGEHQYGYDNQYWCSAISKNTDSAEIFTAVYCDGGTYRLNDQDYTLLMGQRIPPAFISNAPSGFTLELVTRFGIEYFRLRRNDRAIRSKRINVSGLTPIVDENPDTAMIQSASQTLVNVAAKYLEKKSEPIEEISCQIDYPICNLPLGDRALVKSTSPITGETLIDGMYYIRSYKIEFGQDSAATAIEFSNTLFDPEDLMNASLNKSANGAANNAPNVAYKTVTGSVSVPAGGPVCQTTGRSAIVDISAEMFKSTPVITLTPPGGYTATVIASSATSFTVCLVPGGTTQTVNYSIVGVV